MLIEIPEEIIFSIGGEEATREFILTAVKNEYIHNQYEVVEETVEVSRKAVIEEADVLIPKKAEPIKEVIEEPIIKELIVEEPVIEKPIVK